MMIIAIHVFGLDIINLFINFRLVLGVYIPIYSTKLEMNIEEKVYVFQIMGNGGLYRDLCRYVKVWKKPTAVIMLSWTTKLLNSYRLTTKIRHFIQLRCMVTAISYKERQVSWSLELTTDILKCELD